ncbi:MAG TPA: glutathione S-transferase N-terminal domain-containing protein [Phenylobacterium sp.]|jgi:glutathione S-transferase|nr:glutathione S-transferase N-terminal domain-containing protein [Phenylobacterium sp.]
MMLIGQYDSPFVRRVGIALVTYGLAFEHQPWSTFGDADKISKFNPLRRVPTLVMDDRTVFMDSAVILTVVDAMVGPQRAVLARDGEDGLHLLRIAAMAAGVADKAVSLLYERVLREAAFPLWVERCRLQIAETLDLLEAERQVRPTRYLFDDDLSHADVMLATMIGFVSDPLAVEFDWHRWPALKAHAATCEALPAFQQIRQPYKLTMPDEN